MGTEIEFIADVGYRIRFRNKSLVLCASSLGRVGETLSDKQIIGSARALSDYVSGITEVETLPFSRVQITPSAAPPLLDDVAFKFTDDVGLSHWLRGSIKLNPPATYLAIENPHAQDIREGRGIVHLQGATRFAEIFSASGFNSLVICTSLDARRSERAYRTNKFGRRILKIRHVSEFATRVAELCGAQDFSVRDVTYSDAKIVKGRSEFADKFAEINGAGDLKEATLTYIAENWMDELIRVTRAASIFTKPLHYRLERERRLLFDFASDVPEPRIVHDPSLSDFLEVVV